MDYSEWMELTIEEKKQLLVSWIQELLEINKNIATPPSGMYNKLRRRKLLRNYIQDVSAYMRWNYSEEDEKDKKENEETRNHFRRN